MNLSLKFIENSEALPIKEANTEFFAPQDGMWNSFRSMSNHWGIYKDKKFIGYVVVHGEYGIIQGWVHPDERPNSPEFLRFAMNELDVTTAVAGTNNPHFLNSCLQLNPSTSLHTLLFYWPNGASVPKDDKWELPSVATQTDLSNMVDFCHEAVGAPVDWLNGYLGGLIDRKELFYIREGGEVAATCEVRESVTNEGFADVGMIVGKKYRKQGLGSYMLGRAVQIALKQRTVPICSCEAENIGSKKAIEHVGFRSRHAMYFMDFS